jgi:hypothetical protein
MNTERIFFEMLPLLFIVRDVRYDPLKSNEPGFSDILHNTALCSKGSDARDIVKAA